MPLFPPEPGPPDDPDPVDVPGLPDDDVLEDVVPPELPPAAVLVSGDPGPVAASSDPPAGGVTGTGVPRPRCGTAAGDDADTDGFGMLGLGRAGTGDACADGRAGAAAIGDECPSCAKCSAASVPPTASTAAAAAGIAFIAIGRISGLPLGGE